jgi:superfamily II DNA or RNA helicase
VPDGYWTLALEILKSERELGLKKGLVVLATGLGKTGYP